MGRHGSLSHFLPWQMETFDLGQADRFSMLSGLGHDPLQRDIFTALWAGATLYIPNEEAFDRAGELAGWLRDEAITFAHLTPPMMRFLNEGAAEAFRLNALR